VACTGTNFCLRARALATVGWFPEYTITEGACCALCTVRRCVLCAGCCAVGWDESEGWPLIQPKLLAARLGGNHSHTL